MRICNNTKHFLNNYLIYTTTSFGGVWYVRFVYTVCTLYTLYTPSFYYTLLNSTNTLQFGNRILSRSLPPVSMHPPSHLVFDLVDLFFQLLVHLTIFVVVLFVNFVFELLMFFDLLFYNLPF